MVPLRSTLVMIPGTLCDHRMFSRQVRTLRCHANVICASYSGMRNPEQWITKTLQRLPAVFSVAGFSLGGLMALELLRRAPERVERLALIASNTQPGTAKAKRRSAMLRKLWRDRGPVEVAKHVKPAYFHHELQRRRHQQLVLQMALSTPRRAAFAEFAWAAQRPSGEAALRAFTGPLLAVSGAQDHLVPRAWQQALCAIAPRLQWCEIARCGHFVPLEAPVQLNNALIKWINKPFAAVSIE